MTTCSPSPLTGRRHGGHRRRRFARIGEQAAHIRGAGIPVMVATTASRRGRGRGGRLARSEGDIVAPNMTNPTPFGDAARLWARRITAGSTANEAPNAAGPRRLSRTSSTRCPWRDRARRCRAHSLDGEGAPTLDRRMGSGIIAACKDKRLAFALAFPFVRRLLSLTRRGPPRCRTPAWAWWCSSPGRYAHHDAQPGEDAADRRCLRPAVVGRAHHWRPSWGGAFLFRNIARTAVGVVPVLGWAIMGHIGFAGTEAMGHAAIEYFEAGGDIVGVASGAEGP